MRAYFFAFALLVASCGLRSPFSTPKGNSDGSGDTSAAGGTTSSLAGHSGGAGEAAATGDAGVATNGDARASTDGSAGSSAASDGATPGSYDGSSPEGAGSTGQGAGGDGEPIDGVADGGSLGWESVPSDGGLSVSNDPGLPRTVPLPDGTVITYPDDPGTSIPGPIPTSAFPVPGPPGSPPAFGNDVSLNSITGCGEPPLCILRISILTRSGHAYGAAFSSAYPNDTCARDVADDDKHIVLIGDSYPRRTFSPTCDVPTPSIEVAFFTPELPSFLLGADDLIARVDDGFRSEWRLLNSTVSRDNGEYFPLAHAISTLQLIRFDASSGHPALGQVQVPLRHATTGEVAIGFVLFAVLIR